MLPSRRHKLIRRYLTVFAIFLITSVILSDLILTHILSSNLVIVYWKPREDNSISCHYIRSGDALPSIEDMNLSTLGNSIFFHETGCKGGLNSRQACAVEAAANVHPGRQIYVLFSGPVSSYVLNRSCMAKLKYYKNIQYARVHITDYAKGTPLEAMVTNGKLNASEWRVEHTSDTLRYLTLYKWGGVYLDTDVLVLKSFDPLGDNWVGKEDNHLVNCAVIALSNDKIGRMVSEAVIRELSMTFKPNVWEHNGPGAITRVLRKICSPINLSDWTRDTCGGFPVYEPAYFYPVHYNSNQFYFEDKELEEIYGMNKAYTHHTWNKLTNNMTVERNSLYSKMASIFCPRIYEMYGSEFGL